MVNGQPTSYSIHNGGLVSFGAFDHFEFDYNAVDPDGCTDISYSLSPSTSFSPSPPWGAGPLAGLNFSPLLPCTCPQAQLNHFETTPETGFAGVLICKATDCNGEFSLLILYFDWALPVELSSFVSLVSRNNVTLNWTTNAEVNNSAFEVERSVAGENSWTLKGTVAGSGNSSEPVSYSFIDKGLQHGSYNYRLKQIDFNGNFKYYLLDNDVVVSAANGFDLSQNFPNPFNPTTRIEYSIPEGGIVKLLIYDINGRQISQLLNEYKSAGYYNINFDGSNLSSGIYFYKLQLESGANTFTRIMKMSMIK